MKLLKDVKFATMIDSMERRVFLKSALAVAGAMASRKGWSLSQPVPSSETYKLVAAADRARILKAAALYIDETPLTITAFPATHSSGGLHDFYPQADYFWPNPKDPNGPYVNRDGQSNPNNFDDHRRVMVRLSIQMPALTAAWLLTGEKRYAERAGDHLRAWFVTPATRMNPNLQYAQAVQGVSTGRSYGIIDSLHLVEVARAAHFLMADVLNAQSRDAVGGWFSSYLNWLNSSGAR